jgi:hypothetical protein
VASERRGRWIGLASDLGRARVWAEREKGGKERERERRKESRAGLAGRDRKRERDEMGRMKQKIFLGCYKHLFVIFFLLCQLLKPNDTRKCLDSSY